MAQVQFEQVGGTIIKAQAETISDLRQQYTIADDQQGFINGEAAEESASLSDYDFVTFAKKVAGA